MTTPGDSVAGERATPEARCKCGGYEDAIIHSGPQEDVDEADGYGISKVHEFEPAEPVPPVPEGERDASTELQMQIALILDKSGVPYGCGTDDGVAVETLLENFVREREEAARQTPAERPAEGTEGGAVQAETAESIAKDVMERMATRDDPSWIVEARWRTLAQQIEALIQRQREQAERLGEARGVWEALDAHWKAAHSDD